jgi:hypothetical protein
MVEVEVVAGVRVEAALNVKVAVSPATALPERL